MPSKPISLKNDETPKSRARSPRVGQKDAYVPSTLIGVPNEIQQLLLNIFKDSFSMQVNDKSLTARVQGIKQHLFNRDFSSAFGKEAYLEAYALRWSPSRALAYSHIFCHLPALTAKILSLSNLDTDQLQIISVIGGQQEVAHVPTPSAISDHQDQSPVLTHTIPTKKSRIACIGGGAGAELLALACYLHHLNGLASTSKSGSCGEEGKPPVRLDITIIDLADWSKILQRLRSGLASAPPISPYASAEAKAANVPLVDPSTCTLDFVNRDMLKMEPAEMAERFTDATLVTMMFVLNELYNTSISNVTNLLLSLTLLLAPGALLLVVDSPGSYSTVTIGPSDAGGTSTQKRYPMQWLLDHTLLESAAIGSSKNASNEKQWEKLESRDSEWFRLSDKLRYPIELEDMRYQLHLYRRI
ncbi:hypothetical protein MMC28_005804 [Mycoblastus sanguinarius]|nr:hypothetical protein [Mycoblastus sanguinarius]